MDSAAKVPLVGLSKKRGHMPSEAQRLSQAICLGICFTFVTACADEELSIVASSIDVCIDAQLEQCGTEFQLGPIRAGRGLEIPLYVANRGVGDLFISEVTVLEGPVEVVRYPGSVESGAARIALTAWDVELGESQATLRVESNDPERPTLDIRLSFVGVESVIVVCPSEAESLTDPACGSSVSSSLADVRRGDTKVFQVWVGNIGLAPLRVFGAQIDGRSSMPGEFTLQTSTTDGVIASQERRLIGVTYQPLDDVPDEMVYGISEAGRDEVSASWSLSGTGRSNEPPVATIEASPTSTQTGELLELSGQASVDPEGDPLRYEWSFISIPRSSTLELFESASDLLYLMPDVAGRYEIGLTVYDSAGAQDAASVEFEVGAGEALQVDLIWDPSLGDVDLHLVPEGQDMFSLESCSFQTPFQDVDQDGVPDSTAPIHTGDDEGERGIERIMIGRDALESGRFNVMVNAFELAGPVEVNLVVSAQGGNDELSNSVTLLSENCETWGGGLLDVGSRTFVAGVGEHQLICAEGL